ncbi:FAD-dependent oxidoreductase [Streptomyces sp. NPDC058256]|uniref:FAD-dependent oxidoreductase n=1 Tax=Streptomyces sp. NPDC058256 TaxID=3346408 RepID=UPI0036E32D5B
MTSDGTVVVVGGGVSGLTTGVTLLEAGLSVRLVAEEIPGRTSLAAGAMWGPYLVEPWKKVRQWSIVSLDAFRRLADNPATGVRMTSGTEAARHPMPAPEWSELLPGFRPSALGDLPDGFEAGYHFTVPLIDMPVYLAYLQDRFAEGGGVVERRTLVSLDDVEDASVIVNCAGLGSAGLVPDPALRPIRGQHVIVENPGITEFFSEDTGMSPDLVCLYPHGDTVALGGTAVDDDGTLDLDEEAARAIVDRCAAIDPRVRGARVVGHRMGARPTRDEVRVEVAATTYRVPVIHNYGHGGAGVTLSWGCAEEVVGMVLTLRGPGTDGE